MLLLSVVILVVWLLIIFQAKSKGEKLMSGCSAILERPTCFPNEKTQDKDDLDSLLQSMALEFVARLKKIQIPTAASLFADLENPANETTQGIIIGKGRTRSLTPTTTA